MPVVEQDHQHLQLLKPRNIRLSLLGVLVLGAGLVAAFGLGLIGTKKSSPTPSPTPSPQKQAQKYLGAAREPTAEEIRAVKNTIHVEGKITAITAKALTIMPTGQINPLTLKLSDATIYSSGKLGLTADKSSLRIGQVAILSYDSGTTTVISVWGGNNE